MYFSKNIKLLRKRKRRTQDDLAKILTMKRSTLSGYENNFAQPGIQALLAFSNYFNISIDTLIKIDLTKLSEFQLSELERGFDVYIKGSKLRVLTSTVDSKNNENIELINEKAKAGYKNGYADSEYISDLPTFQLPFLSKEKKYRTFQISGDSMLPIPNGAYVTGEFIQDWNLIKNDKAYIILTLDDGIVFKLAKNHIKTQKSLELISLNIIYKPYFVPITEIKEVWKFTNYMNLEMPETYNSEAHILKTVSQLQSDVNFIKKYLGLTQK